MVTDNEFIYSIVNINENSFLGFSVLARDY